MNKDEFCEWLQQYLSDYRVHSKLIGELLVILAASGSEVVFFRQLVKNLTILSQMGVQATRHKDFEPIESGLYSMHFDYRDFNIRILYAFLANGEPVLLSAFYERGGKRRTDYSGRIAPALDRLAETKGMN